MFMSESDRSVWGMWTIPQPIQPQPFIANAIRAANLRFYILLCKILVAHIVLAVLKCMKIIAEKAAEESIIKSMSVTEACCQICHEVRKRIITHKKGEDNYENIDQVMLSPFSHQG